MQSARLRMAMEAAQATPNGGSALRAWLGADVAAMSVGGALTVAAATLVYHWARAEWRLSGEPRRVPADTNWVAGLASFEIREVNRGLVSRPL